MKYGHLLFTRKINGKKEKFKLNPLKGTDIKTTCKEAKLSAAGLDQWATQDFAILSDEAYDWLASMFNTIEAGAQWPEPTRHAKGVYLLKDPDGKGDPLNYRILLVTSVPYRRWAATRLRQCNDWIGEWATSDMFAGIAGMSAEEAWYSTAILIERAKLQGKPASGASVDIHKCFDQLVRELLYDILEEAGCPDELLIAYKSFIENLIVHNFINGHVGQGHAHRCGIPQGCPLSMPFVSLLLRAWAVLVISKGCKPRSLADDLLILAIGDGHARKMSDALDATLNFLADMGGNVASNKSIVCSTCSETRKFFTRKFWTPIKACIRVANHFRDLGTHLNLTFTSCGQTCNKRIWWAVKICKTIGRLPISYKHRANLIRAKVLSAAKYGTPASHVGGASLCALTTAIMDAICPHTTRRNACRVFEFNSHGPDVDPDIIFGIEKFVLLRRVLAKDPELETAVKDISDIYTDFGYQGILTPSTDVNALVPAPQVGHPDRKNWEPNDPDVGPIGLMISTVFRMGAAIDLDTFTIHQKNEVTTSFLTIPYNHLRKALENHFVQARSRAAEGRRTLNIGLTETNRQAYKYTHSHMTGEQQTIMAYLSSGGALSNDTLFDMGLVRSKKCPFCDCTIQTIEHTLWECTHPPLVEARKHQSGDPMNINNIPFE